MCHHDFMKLFIWSFSCGIGNHQKSPPGLSIISKLSNVKLPPIILPHLSLSWTTISWGIWQWPASFVGSPLQRALTTTLVVDGRKWCKSGLNDLGITSAAYSTTSTRVKGNDMPLDKSKNSIGSVVEHQCDEASEYQIFGICDCCASWNSGQFPCPRVSVAKVDHG